jgi:hypothetical protein
MDQSKENFIHQIGLLWFYGPLPEGSALGKSCVFYTLLLISVQYISVREFSLEKNYGVST